MGYSRRQWDDISRKLSLISQILPAISGLYGAIDSAATRRSDKSEYDKFLSEKTSKPGVTLSEPGTLEMPGFAQAPVSRGTAPTTPVSPLPSGGIGPLPPVRGEDIQPLPINAIPRKGASLPMVNYDPGGKMGQLSAEDMASLFTRISPDSPEWKAAQMMYSGQQDERARAKEEETTRKAEQRQVKADERLARQDERQAQLDTETAVDKRISRFEKFGLSLNPALGQGGVQGIEQVYKSWTTPGETPIFEVGGVPVFTPSEDYMPGSVQYVTDGAGNMAISYMTKGGKPVIKPLPGFEYKAGTKPKPRSGSGKAKATKLEDLI